VIEADSSKRSMSEIEKQNRKRNHDKNNGSCVVKKGNKNATVYNSLYSPSTLATLLFSGFHIYELLRIARPVGLLNKICGINMAYIARIARSSLR